METPHGANRPQSKNERRKQQRLQKDAALKQGLSSTRRGLLTAIMPGGWIPEAIQVAKGKKDITDLSTAAKVSITKDAVLAGVTPIFATKIERTDNRPLKEKVLSFTWKDAENPERLQKFTDMLADEYLKSTQTPRLKKENLTGPGKTNFYTTTDAYIKAVKQVDQLYTPTSTKWGYAHYDSDKVFIDLEKLKQQAQIQNGEAGLALIDALWHEWGHRDVVERTQGQLINSPTAGFPSVKTGAFEQFRRYRGGVVYTDTDDGFGRFDEVWNESITVRRIAETLQIGNNERLISAADYYQNGVDFFSLFTSVVNIPLQKMYEMHATSDFEGFALLVGQNLPGNKLPLAKGITLFEGIHQSNRNTILQSGALNLIPKQ